MSRSNSTSPSSSSAASSETSRRRGGSESISSNTSCGAASTLVLDAEEKLRELEQLQSKQQPSDSCFFVVMWVLLLLAPIGYTAAFLTQSDAPVPSPGSSGNALVDSLGVECGSSKSKSTPFTFSSAAKSASPLYQETATAAAGGSSNLFLFRPSSLDDVWPPPSTRAGLAAYARCVKSCPRGVGANHLQQVKRSLSTTEMAVQQQLIWSYNSTVATRNSSTVVAFFSTKDTFPLGGRLCVTTGTGGVGSNENSNNNDVLLRWGAVELRSSFRLVLFCIAVSASLGFAALYAMRLMLRGVLVVGGIFTLLSLGVLSYALREESSRIYAASSNGNVPFVVAASDWFHVASISTLALLSALVCFGYIGRKSYIPRVATFLKVATKVAVLAPSSAFLPVVVSLTWIGLAATPAIVAWVALATGTLTQDARVLNDAGAGVGELNGNASLSSWFSTVVAASSNSTRSVIEASSSSTIPLSIGYATLGFLLALLLAQTTARAISSAVLSGPAYFWLESSTASKSCAFIPPQAQIGPTCWRFVLGFGGAATSASNSNAPIMTLGIASAAIKSFRALPSLLLGALVQWVVDDLALFFACGALLWRWAFEGTLLAVPSAAPWYCCCSCLVQPPMPHTSPFLSGLFSCSSLYDPSSVSVGRRLRWHKSVALVHAAALRHARAASLPLLVGCELFVRCISVGVGAAAAVLAWFLLPESSSSATSSSGTNMLSSLFIGSDEDEGRLVGEAAALVRFNAAPLLVVFWACYVVSSAFLSVFPTLCKAVVMSYHINRLEDSNDKHLLRDDDDQQVDEEMRGSAKTESSSSSNGEECQATALELIALFERVDGQPGTWTEFESQPPAVPTKIISLETCVVES